MLNPDWLEGCPDEIIKIYQDAETAILLRMAEQISGYDFFIPSSMHSKALLEATGATQEAVAEELAKISGKSKKAVTQLMTEAGNQTIVEDGKVYKAAKVYKEEAISKNALNRIVQTGINQALNSLQNITRTTENAAGTQIYRVLDSSWMQVASGATNRIKAVSDAIKQLADSGLSAFTYDSGHVDTLETAVRRAIVTGVNQTALRVSDQIADDLECDLVEVSAHSGARPQHAVWQGHIFSRSGKSKKYPALRASQESGGTGYGTGAGLGGWNCRHSFGPWVEGQPRRWSQEQLDKMNEKNVRYNGKDLTEYEASQQQRYYERQIRKYKREEALGVEGASDKVKYWKSKQKDFINQTGFKRQYDRERVYTDFGARHAFGGTITWLPKGDKIDAESFKQLRSYANDRGITLTGFKNSDVDISAATDAIDAATKVIGRYPLLSGDEKRPFTIKLQSGMLDDDFGCSYPTAPHIIQLNANAYRDAEKLKIEYDKLTKIDENGKIHFVPGTGPESIVFHEMGHAFSTVYDVDGAEILASVLGVTRIEAVEWAGKNISDYAGTATGDEIIAECFSMFFSSSADKKKEIIDFITRCDKIALWK